MKSSHTIGVGFFIGVLFLLGVVSTNDMALAQNPWDTPQGQACFERWIAYAMARLNAYNGSQDFNGRKPWSINKYGVLEGNPQFGPHSVAAPDDFPRYNYNRYWWIWDHYNPDPNSGWRVAEWNGAGIEGVASYVLRCVAQSGGTTQPQQPSTGGGQTASTINWGTNVRGQGQSGQQFTYVCPANGSPASVWGTDIYTDDSSICTAAVHAGLITFAAGGTVAIEIRPGQPSYTGSVRNGVSSSSYGSWGSSYVFVGSTAGTTTQPQQPSTSTGAILQTNKNVYAPNEGIVVEYSGLPGNQQDWITITQASAPENTYGQWFFTGGKQNGSLNFNGLSPGNYEARVYFNWPQGGYNVQARRTFTVAQATQPQQPSGGSQTLSMEYGIDRPGSDFKNFDLSEVRPELCQAECAMDFNCKAYTDVKPGIQGPNARCWLKSSVPAQVSNSCCVSGAKGGGEGGGGGSQTFSNPGFQNGYRLDWCLYFAQQCGEPAASAWCRAIGYSRATQWNEAVDIGASSPTYVIGDGRVCNQQFCDGFSSITCAR
jgi:LCCL domain-containing protein/PAN domain-containing protein